MLERAVLSILNPTPANVKSENVTPSLEELYTAVQNLCSRNKSYGEKTYQKLKSLINAYVRETLLLTVLEESEQSLLTILEQTWDGYTVKMRMIRNIFLCLDRIYVLSTPRLASIWDMCLDLFRKEIIFHEKVLQRLLRSSLDAISAERTNTSSSQRASRIQMRNIMRMMVDLDIYESYFEPKFLQESKDFYNGEAMRKLRFISSITFDTIVNYLDFVAEKLKEEELRIVAYGLAMTTTSKKIEKILEKELIEAHLDVLVNNCVELLFGDRKNFRHIKLAYQLFSRLPEAIARMCFCFNAFVKNRGKALVNLSTSDPEKDKTLIKDLLDFKDTMDVIVRECLGSNQRFANTLKDAFETFVNIRTNKVAELIAKHVDSMLRDAYNLEVSFDQQIDKLLVLFRFIHGKDIFEAFYQRDLSKRLLGGKSASVDAEKLVLMKLKQECGGAFTSKLEAMFKDMELSRELTASFKVHLDKKENASKTYPIDLSVSVLTTGIWPTYLPIELLLGQDLRAYEDVFQEFYLSKHTGRKLTWQHCFGHCLLRAQFGGEGNKRDKELQVSFMQALVLMQFNSKNTFSYGEIRNAILPPKLEGTEENELRRTLQSLACGKIRVLTKSPKGRDVLDTDSFALDETFDHKLFRLKINQVQWKETFEENVNTQEKVNQDRQYQLDAAAVRIMKARKTMLHNALVNEIYEKVNFPASSAETKKRIESLIERDYLRRDKENPILYHYVA